MYTFCYKNFSRTNAPLKLFAPDRNSLIKLRICTSLPESSLGVNVILKILFSIVRL